MNTLRIYSVILGPHISEKTTNLGEANNQYTFRVARDATKPEIKKAIETIFEVGVDAVQTLNVKGKTKRSSKGKIRRRPSWKKAYVKLAEGQEIDFAEKG
ncbi:MAG: 50S ribosomal protein L23 [SAR86 cluster bacterium]|uniref:Large ribosomal subunit protein uL23 n=1 Tax=SAR86 cluster bacterium TaxID=2030880 RepID=A0A2A4MGG7_9GAMM|nr:MAG: 50S ribosomal protein L23 [SAR86 cluster bacterium]